MKRNIDIDFVVTWLDDNDPNWKQQYSHYRGVQRKEDQGRFRDWDFFRYWFRAVETYAPWVHKVFLVTNGKFPDWINDDCPKLVLVKHSDYIPNEYLPTFCSRTIELNMHRIEGLSEHFVYFNDDMFLNSAVSPEDYFKDGLPCDCNKERLIWVPTYHPDNKFGTDITLYCDIALLNHHFERNKTVKESFRRWFGLHLGLKGILASFLSLKPNHFIDFEWRHFEQPFLKSAFQEAWASEGGMLQKSCTRFRNDVSLNSYFIRYWQFATNRFYPSTLKYGRAYNLNPNLIKSILNDFNNKRVKSICLNDTPKVSPSEYESMKVVLQEAFARKFPRPSSFEK